MQQLGFANVETAIIIVGGAGGPMSTGQGVGSLALTDMIVVNANVGIETSLDADYSTSFILQNAAFQGVDNIVIDSAAGQVLYPGDASVVIFVDSWGFGQVANATGETDFVNGNTIQGPPRPTSLVVDEADDSGTGQLFYFTRRRPSYLDLGNSQLMDVKAYGASGNGVDDDTAILNHILSVAANISAIVYIPHGVYIISDTLYVPVGSRIIGQAWPQIMATGEKFGDMAHPKVAVQVGEMGSVGVAEIQCMLFTVRGPTAGAVLLEWNVHESSKGSAGLWGEYRPFFSSTLSGGSQRGGSIAQNIS
jgi:hypothetical protein